MSEGQPAALKEIFDRARMRSFADETKALWPAFDAERFHALATTDLDERGIMQRMRLAAEAFDATLPADYGEALGILVELAPRLRHAFASITLCEFIVLRGMQDFDRSMDALKLFTRYGSAEFAIRHFLERDLHRTLAVMRAWALDDNEHVRRLASEGSRPRLPWSFQIRALVADPSPALPILDALKADSSRYVRKSVANHFNDIGKDHPDLLIDTLGGWPRDDERTAWIAKHALRTLIKKGDPRALALVGATGKARVRVEGFSVAPRHVLLGSYVTISAEIVSAAEEMQHLVADYAVHYVKKNGAPSRKVFKLKKFDLPPGGRQALSIRRAIRDFSTRTHNAGHHRVELMVNGQTVAEGGFELIS